MTLDNLFEIINDKRTNDNVKELDMYNMFDAFPSSIEMDGLDYNPWQKQIIVHYLRYETNEIFAVEVDIDGKRIFVSRTQMPEKTLQQEKDGYSLRHPSPTCRALTYTERQVSFSEMKEWLNFM